MVHEVKSVWFAVPLPDVPGNNNIAVEGPGRLQWGESLNDIVCCVKRFASDADLSQDTGTFVKTKLYVCEFFNLV